MGQWAKSSVGRTGTGYITFSIELSGEFHARGGELFLGSGWTQTSRFREIIALHAATGQGKWKYVSPPSGREYSGRLDTGEAWCAGARQGPVSRQMRIPDAKFGAPRLAGQPIRPDLVRARRTAGERRDGWERFSCLGCSRAIHRTIGVGLQHWSFVIWCLSLLASTIYAVFGPASCD
jgi:hypothetical protein